MNQLSTIARTFTLAAVAALALAMAPTAKADDKGCSTATLQGTFAFNSNGFITAPPAFAGPVGEVGTQTFDGKGGSTATAMLSQNGNIVPVTITGTYTVNSDCTGSFTGQVSPIGITLHVYFVIANNGSEFYGMEPDAGLVITRVAKKIFPGRNI